VAELSWNFIGSSCVGLAIIYYLAFFGNDDIGSITVKSAHACMFVAWKAFLQDTFKKAGCKEGSGALCLATFIPVVLLLTGWGDIDTSLLVNIVAFTTTIPFGIGPWLGGSNFAKASFGCAISDGK